MKKGEILEVFTDDPASEEDIKSLIKRIGEDLLKIEKKVDTFSFIIRKNK
jgi:TusA-related sulfurtransferase